MHLDRVKASRRDFLKTGAGLVMAAPLGPVHSLAQQGAGQPIPRGTSVASVKALVFDTFGTVVDWRTSVARADESTGATSR